MDKRSQIGAAVGVVRAKNARLPALAQWVVEAPACAQRQPVPYASCLCIAIRLRDCSGGSISDSRLNGRRTLVVEDGDLSAESLNDLLVEAGVHVPGLSAMCPRPSRWSPPSKPIDGALLDVNVRSQPIFPIADALLERGVPCAFRSGGDRYALPQRFAHLSYCIEPDPPRTITPLLSNQTQPAEHY